jgi:hypothetical protein
MGERVVSQAEQIWHRPVAHEPAPALRFLGLHYPIFAIWATVDRLCRGQGVLRRAA